MDKSYTPMIQQYLQMKAENPDAILFFRLGDFYEMFFEDAIEMSKELDITLTGREGGQEDRIPMCGVPYHAAEGYISKLVGKGYRVAICEQVEDPKTTKNLVRREIVRIVTPGTANLSPLLEEKRNHFLVCLSWQEHAFALAAIDVSTGAFLCTEYQGEDAPRQAKNELTRLNPREVIPWQEKVQEELENICLVNGVHCTKLQADERTQILEQLHPEDVLFRSIPLNQRSESLLEVIKALSWYVQNTTKLPNLQLNAPEYYQLDWQMVLDLSTRRSLELTQTMRDNQYQGSLLWVMDRTRTSVGGRMLHQWILQPLTNKAQIDHRLSAVQEFVENPGLREAIQEQLQKVTDLERLLSRISFGSANARDLQALQRTISLLPNLKELLQDVQSSLLLTQTQSLPNLTEIDQRISQAIVDEPPVSIREGGMIRQGYHHDVDVYGKAANEGKDWVLALEKEEREQTGIRNLKVGYNRVFGYYLEVTRSQLANVPEHYIRKQTLSNGERYITQRLKELEETILGAETKLVELEFDLFIELRDWIGGFREQILQAASVIAVLDCIASMAEIASRYRYCKPSIHLGRTIKIREGRHPVVERTLKNSPYIPNDLMMDEENQRILIITGPNMAGKSTYLRMNALIVLMAQMGSYVPASSAEIGIVDRIFTRVGTGDDLAGGQSTFMVEMTELSQILASATHRSFLILDEIGRGTSTFDGMSIARAALEYIQNPQWLGARTLFATHYHELTDMEQLYEGVRNFSVAVRGKDENIVFLHRIVPGGMDKSYGIEVARLAGLPRQVVKRAREVLKLLESQEQAFISRDQRSSKDRQMLGSEQLSLLAADEHPILKELKAKDIMSMSPIEALNYIHHLQMLLNKE